MNRLTKTISTWARYAAPLALGLPLLAQAPTAAFAEYPDQVRTASLAVRQVTIHATELLEKRLAALGTMSAGLAHELNNPASAAKRAASDLADALDMDALLILSDVDGVMMGRAAYQEPWRLLQVDPLLFGEAAPFSSLKEAALSLMPYIERELSRGARRRSMLSSLDDCPVLSDKMATP